MSVYLINYVPPVDPRIRGLCGRPYPGHPHGCPNSGRGKSLPDCPPRAPLIDEVFSAPLHVIVHRFHLAAHVARMRQKHPAWSQRQLENCLYWQGTARKQLNEEIRQVILHHLDPLAVTIRPEAMGVNVTALCAQLGVTLEWPPVNYTYQVALVGPPAGGRP